MGVIKHLKYANKWTQHFLNLHKPLASTQLPVISINIANIGTRFIIYKTRSIR